MLDDVYHLCIIPHFTKEGKLMAKKRRRVKRTRWSKAEDRVLKAHSKNRTRVTRISKEMKRTVGAVRQRAFAVGISVGHRKKR